jgi:hypothetical protein
VRGAKGSIRLRFLRHALRRVAGVAVLMLFAHQTIASAWIACDEHGSERPAAGTVAMAHDHHSPTHARQANVPAQSHRSGCDHSGLDSGCCMLAGCAVAYVSTPFLAVAPPPIRLFAIAAPTGTFLSLDIAPAVPPPRA